MGGDSQDTSNRRRELEREEEEDEEEEINDREVELSCVSLKRTKRHVQVSSIVSFDENHCRRQILFFCVKREKEEEKC